MKTQIVFIHGGEVFDTYEDYLSYLNSAQLTLEKLGAKKWRATLQAELPEAEVFLLQMPNGMNARYSEWKIWFEKVLPLLGDKAVYVGHSLGGIFLAKYFSENGLPENACSVHLVAAPFDASDAAEPLGDFEFDGNLEALSVLGQNAYLYFSTDDPVVSYAQGERYAERLPSATFRTFTDRQHFNQETFPEIIEDIRSCI